MYTLCRDIYVRAAAYSLDCHGGAVIYRRLYVGLIHLENCHSTNVR